MGNTVLPSSHQDPPSVHPHTSGEYRRCILRLGLNLGSSPHKWGIRRCVHCWPCRVRFIPTQVGNTQPLPGACASSPVHPHTSGEYVPVLDDVIRPDGSSPHKWGIQHQPLQEYALLRFIPTQVGNTVSVAVPVAPRTVHPHTSGEYQLLPFQRILESGSSPHKWGIRPLSLGSSVASRFIPTQVGNTYPSLR